MPRRNPHDPHPSWRPYVRVSPVGILLTLLIVILPLLLL